METRRITWSRILLRAWIPFLILAGAGIAWQLYRFLPTWIENSVEQSLLQEGVVVTAFPVEHIGFNQARIGPGTALMDRHEVGWNTILLGYGLDSLAHGAVEKAVIDEPVLSLRAVPVLAYELEPAAGVVAPDTKPAVATAERFAEVPEQAPSSDTGPLPVPIPDVEPVKAPGFWKQLQELPFANLELNDGVVNFLIQDELFRSTSMNGWLEKEEAGTFSEWMFENGEMTLIFSIRAPSTEEVVTFQAEAAMPPGAVRSLANEWITRTEKEQPLPRLASSGQLVVDLFGEVDSLDVFSGSAEASIDELAVRLPESPLILRLGNVLAAAFYQVDRLNMEAGMEVILPDYAGWKADPFGMRLSLKDTTRLSMETEIIDWNYKELAGKAALRGQASLDQVGGPGWMRIEGSFEEIATNGILVDPFSIELEGLANAFGFRISPLGLHQNGSLWIEELAGQWDLENRTGSAAFQWFGLVGESMGFIQLDLAVPNESDLLADFFLSDSSAERQMEGAYQQDEKGMQLSTIGSLPLAWINTLADWSGERAYSLNGLPPVLDLQIQGAFPFFTGRLGVELDDLAVALDGGVVVEGIQSELDFIINVMPMTNGWQVTRIGRIHSDDMQLSDIEVQWELPSIRHLVIRHFTGSMGDGTVELDPFVIDPLKPSLKTVLRASHIEADLLRRWLGEERFSMEGKVSGSIGIGWLDGQLILGEGRFSLDRDPGTGNFNFTDPAFLREKFGSFGGVPVELRDRLLNALLQRGIRIDSLEVSFGPATEPGMLLLRIAISGECKSDLLEVPIKGFVINNLISAEDLSRLLGLVTPVRVEAGTAAGD